MHGDPSSQINPFSRAVVHLTLEFDGTALSTGSGVVSKLPYSSTGPAAEFQGRLFLVTALHNFTGREPDGRVKHKEGGLPNFVLVEGFHFKERFPLYAAQKDPNNDAPLFWIHPVGAGIDVSILPLSAGSNYPGTLDHSFFNIRENEASMPLEVSQICFIIGFPEGLMDRPEKDLILPIWKIGHLASEPLFFFNKEPVVLIDATTRPGMSGAPVFVTNNRRYERRNRLVGIYTGRTSELSDIGRVFVPPVLPEIFQKGPPQEKLNWQGAK
jgi:hypothetical protein